MKNINLARPSAQHHRRRQRWVIKAGSNMICSGGPLLLREWMQQVAKLRLDFNIEVVWVTSGAIATAVERTVFSKKKKTLPEKPALSAIGQPIIMDLYLLALQAQGLIGAQILLTSNDLSDSSRLLNFRNTVETLLKWGVTPVLNENDAVSTQEIQFGDNDSLSARVAIATGSDRLIILTDVDGLYTADPKKNPKAKLLTEVSKIDQKLLNSLESKPGSSHSTGGMFSKISAARLASSQGVETLLLRGDRQGVLIDSVHGTAIGTRIRAQR